MAHFDEKWFSQIVARQIGRIADKTGLTVREAREAIAQFDARQSAESLADESLDAIEARFTQAETSGTLSQAVRNAVLGSRAQALPRWAQAVITPAA